MTSAINPNAANKQNSSDEAKNDGAVCVYDGKDRWALEFDSSGYGKAVATLIAELQSSPCFAVFLSKRQRIRRQAGIQECMFQGLSSWDCPRSHR